MKKIILTFMFFTFSSVALPLEDSFYNAMKYFSFGVAGTLGVYYSVKNIGPVLLNKFLKSYGRPKSITFVRNEKLRNVMGEVNAPGPDGMSDSQKQKLTNIVSDTKEAFLNGDYFANLLLYGSNKREKIMFLQAMACCVGFDFVVVSGSHIFSMLENDIESILKAARELDRILRWAERSRSRRMIIFDRADLLFLNREDASEAQHKFLSSFLAQVERSYDNKFMFVLLADDPNCIDEAILNRMGYSCKFA